MTYEYRIHTGDKEEGKQLLTISPKDDCIEVFFVDENNKRQFISFNERNLMQTAIYYNEAGKEYRKVMFDYTKKHIMVIGDQNKSYPLKTNTFDNNSGLFYVFSILYPSENKVLKFQLLQSSQNRIVDMYLTLIGQETLLIGDKKIDAYKYEMGLRGFPGRLFWPHKYNYWYSVDKRIFLKYEGLDKDHYLTKIELITLPEESKK